VRSDKCFEIEKEGCQKMKAIDVLNHFKEVGHWVNWERTCDTFLYGESETEVSGIATAWIPTNKALRRAGEEGLNLFITHEPAFYANYSGDQATVDLIAEKKNIMDDFGIVLLRCHDTWDRMPEVGIPDSWATFLGFETEERPIESFYKICLVGERTVEEVARAVQEKTRVLGQDVVLIFGDRKKKVSRMAVGTGAITNLLSMHKLNADVILATDDGFNYWSGGLWAADADVPLLVVNHATAELPGMQAMAGYLAEKFPGTPAKYLPVAFPYSAVCC